MELRLGRNPVVPVYHRVRAAAGGAPHSRGSARGCRNRPRGNPKGNAEMGPASGGSPAGAVLTIFARPDTAHVHSQFVVIAGMLPAGAGDPRKQSPSSNPCGGMALTTRSLSLHSRLGTGRRSGLATPRAGNKAVQRPAQAPTVGVFPNPEPCSGSPAPSLVETHDDGAVTDRRHMVENLMLANPARRAGGAASKGTAKSNLKGPSPRRLRHASRVERRRAQPPSRLRGRPSEQGPNGHTDDDITGVVNAGVNA